MSSRWQTCGAWLVAAILAWAGGAKAMNPAAFAEAISGFRLVPWPVGVALALYLPWLELLVAVSLLLRRWRAGALVLATGLFVVFTLVWAVTWIRGVDVSCGCFGGSGRESTAWAFGRSVLLTLGVGWLTKCGIRQP